MKVTKKTTKKETITHKEHEELKEMIQRIHAEFQNYKKRTENERTKFIQLSNEELIKKLIPALDNFELALTHKHENTEFVQGMELIYAQILETLEQEGLQRIPCTGKFNPELHEAVLVEETKHEPNTILQELQKGYTLGGKVIRSSKVKISKKKQEVK